MFGKVAALAAAGMMIAGQAAAADAAIAQVSAVQGSAVIAQNGRVAPLTGAASLKAGDRVVAKDGQVSLSFADGCKVTVKANSMATIGAASPCASQQGLVTAGGDSAQLFGLTWFGTTLVVLGVVGALYLVFDDDDDSGSP